MRLPKNLFTGTYVKPKISDTIIRGGRTIQLLNTPVYRCKRSDNSLGYQVLKRFFDIVLSLIAIIISSPILLFTAIAIRAYDGGDDRNCSCRSLLDRL